MSLSSNASDSSQDSGYPWHTLSRLGTPATPPQHRSLSLSAPSSPSHLADETDPFLSHSYSTTPLHSPRIGVDTSYRPRSFHHDRGSPLPSPAVVSFPDGLLSTSTSEKLSALPVHAASKAIGVVRRTHVVFILVLSLFAVTIFGVITRLDNSSLDQYLNLQPDDHGSGSLLVVEQPTLEPVDLHNVQSQTSTEAIITPYPAQLSEELHNKEPLAKLVLEILKETEPAKEEKLLKRIPINIRPKTAPLDSSNSDPEERFLGYLPHSGFHNQRLELQNALMLGKLLNRTVLIPPVWVGWPTPTQYYDDLAASWTTAMLLNSASFRIDSLEPDSALNKPADYPTTLHDYPFPTSAADDPRKVAQRLAHLAKTAAKWRAMGYTVRLDGFPITNLTAKDCKSYSPECRHTYKDSFLAWSALVNLSSVNDRVATRDRWDIRERAIESSLGVKPEEVYVLKDRQVYDFKFVDEVHPEGKLIIADEYESHWARRVSMPALRELPHRVVLVGSLFGSGRVNSKDQETFDKDEAVFAQAMAFRTPELLAPADQIRDRLGGGGSYLGVHARVGDGKFSSHAGANMQQLWEKLMRRLGTEESTIEEMWDQVKPAQELERMAPILRKRSSELDRDRNPNGVTWPDLAEDFYETVEAFLAISGHSQTAPIHHKRSTEPENPASLQRRPMKNLECRSPLHVDPTLSHLNTPLYLATDARSPLSDPNLAPFFRTFPCTFILSDFDRSNELNHKKPVIGVDRMLRLANEADEVDLGRLFLPFLEAVIAAKAGITVGTPGSTFSSFAQGDLHQAYRNDIKS